MTDARARPARVTDVPSLTEIYNHYIATSHWDVATYQRGMNCGDTETREP